MSQKNHILFVSSWYPNRNNPTHGIFNKAFAEAASLYARISILHVCSDEQLSSDFEIVESAEGTINTLLVYYRKIKSTLPLVSQLKKRKQLLRGFEKGYQQLVSKAGRPDLIQLNVVMPAGIGVRFLSRKYNIPYVINEGWSGYCPEDGSYKGFALKYYTRKIIAGAKALMPVSEDLKAAMLNHGLKGNYFIVPNVVDVSLFVPKPAAPHSNFRFVHISTLDDSQKNVSGILRAFKNACISQPGMQLTIVGEGSNRPLLERSVKALGLSSTVKFTGRLLDTKLVEELNQHDALVMFSNYETFCLTVAESLACGIPVITSRAGGLTNHISTGFGKMIEKKNEKDLSESFLFFKTGGGSFDSVAMRRFITDNYSKEKIGSQLRQIYDLVLLNKSAF